MGGFSIARRPTRAIAIQESRIVAEESIDKQKDSTLDKDSIQTTTIGFNIANRGKMYRITSVGKEFYRWQETDELRSKPSIF